MSRPGLAGADEPDRDYLDWLQRDLRLHLTPGVDADRAEVDPLAGWRVLGPEAAARLAVRGRGRDH